MCYMEPELLNYKKGLWGRWGADRWQSKRLPGRPALFCLLHRLLK